MTTEIKPDGYCAWHPEKGFALPIECESEIDARWELSLQDEKNGWQIKPVNIVEHGEYLRLKKLEEWALEFKEGVGQRVLSPALDELDALTSERGER